MTLPPYQPLSPPRVVPLSLRMPYPRRLLCLLPQLVYPPGMRAWRLLAPHWRLPRLALPRSLLRRCLKSLPFPLLGLLLQ